MPKESMTRSAGSPSATGVRPRSASRPSHEPPWGLRELGYPASTGKTPSRRKSFDCIGGLCDEGFGLSPPRLLGDGRFANELRQAARRAQPHLEWIGRVGARVIGPREMVAGGLVAQVEYQIAGRPRARTTGVTAHHGLLSTEWTPVQRRRGFDRITLHSGIEQSDLLRRSDTAWGLGRSAPTGRRSVADLAAPRAGAWGHGLRIREVLRISSTVRRVSERGVMSSHAYAACAGRTSRTRSSTWDVAAVRELRLGGSARPT